MGDIKYDIDDINDDNFGRTNTTNAPPAPSPPRNPLFLWGGERKGLAGGGINTQTPASQ